MTEDELKAIEAQWAAIDALSWKDARSPAALDELERSMMVDALELASVPALVAEVRRLRGLVKVAESLGCNCGAYTELSGCPWCHGEPHREPDGSCPDSNVIDHAASCPAFTPSGDVR